MTLTTDALLADIGNSLADGPLKWALRAAFDAGVKFERGQVLEDDEQASEMRRVTRRLETLMAGQDHDWFWITSETSNHRLAGIFFMHQVSDEMVTVPIAANVNPPLAELIVLSHNHMRKLLMLARLGLDARARTIT